MLWNYFIYTCVTITTVLIGFMYGFRVETNSVLCVLCVKWIHNTYAGVKRVR